MPPVPKRRARSGPLYVVEHMEEGLEEWCRLEYMHMCEVVSPERLLFLRWPAGEDAAALSPEGAPPPQTAVMGLQALRPTLANEGGAQAVEGAPALPSWDRICLLDMDAEEALEPRDAANFDALILGGILGNVHEREDGTYGSDDRTRELRDLSFVHRRHLGPMQMTTDTALLVCSMVMEEAKQLAEIPWIDSPEIADAAAAGAENGTGEPSDCVCMEGFRYVARRGHGGEWEPALPRGMKELLIRDANNDILDQL